MKERCKLYGEGNYYNKPFGKNDAMESILLENQFDSSGNFKVKAQHIDEPQFTRDRVTVQFGTKGYARKSRVQSESMKHKSGPLFCIKFHNQQVREKQNK